MMDNRHTHTRHGHDDAAHARKMYLKLLLMALLSFIAMYVLMYAMVDTFKDIYPSYNQLYMAGLMAAPMVLIELIVMGAMYKKKGLNVLIALISLIVGLGFFFGIREQAAISDTQFLKSMIPHHSGAILMCRKATLTDPDIQALCRSITQSQQTEIDQMRNLLNRK